MFLSGKKFRAGLFVVLVLTGLSACTPRLSPLYRDYEVPPEQHGQSEAVRTKLEAALEEAGWHVVASDVPNIVRTEPLTLSNWGLYKVTVYLEAAPIGGEYVRLYFHPYREYVTGGRSKIPFLTKRIRSTLVPAVTQELEEQGLHPAGLPYKDDRLTTR